MGCSQLHILCGRSRFHHLAISLLILLISSSSPDTTFFAQGRKLIRAVDPSQTVVKDEKRGMVRAQIGSRPPRCERRCSGCGHCEAIQVPTNPQIKNGASTTNSTTLSSPSINANFNAAAAAATSAQDYSNYKPMSWKCKCGNLIFNP